MSTRSLFVTRIHVAPLMAQGEALNARLLQECLQFREEDAGGRKWSKSNYPGGYTSYHSLFRLYELSPTFDELRKRINRHVKDYVQALELDTDVRKLRMTDCWINIMPRHVVHGLHLHPTSVISGTYYVQTPPGCAGLKFEDPRLDRYMCAPPRRADAQPDNRTWHTEPAVAGNVVLFESWLRHEVPPNPVAAERISISFNYA